MLTRLPTWPRNIPRVFKPLATFRDPHNLHPLDLLGLRAAARRHAEAHAIQNSGMMGSWAECFFSNRSDFTAFNTSTSEGSLLAGPNMQPEIPASFWTQGNRGYGRAISFLAKGILGTTGTPTITFQWRLGTTVGSTYLSGTSVGVSAAITTASGVSNKYWEARLDLVCNTPGQGSGNTTISGAGYVTSPAGFATPFTYAVPDSATWTSTHDGAATSWLNLSVTWSASSASNTITCKQLLAFGQN